MQWAQGVPGMNGAWMLHLSNIQSGVMPPHSKPGRWRLAHGWRGPKARLLTVTAASKWYTATVLVHLGSAPRTHDSLR